MIIIFTHCCEHLKTILNLFCFTHWMVFKNTCADQVWGQIKLPIGPSCDVISTTHKHMHMHTDTHAHSIDPKLLQQH